MRQRFSSRPKNELEETIIYIKKILNQIKQGKLTDEVTSTLEKVASDLSASYE